MSTHEYFIGLLSGTSIDGVDCVVVDFAQTPPALVGTHSEPIPAPLHQKIHALCADDTVSLIDLGETDVALGRVFANAVKQLLNKSNLNRRDILAIGSHGQTIKHHPTGQNRFTLQIGDPNTISYLTGICTIADFRRKDMAAGGQGAPLAPLFHQSYFSDPHSRCAVLNLGGIANISLLAHKGLELIGFDTGPANVLMDGWINAKKNLPYDDQGQWARTGTVDQALLHALLEEPYFQLSPPKSTGRELFNMRWLQAHLGNFPLVRDEDVQATLLEYTAMSVVNSVDWETAKINALFVCGGGARNSYLMERLQALLTPVTVSSSSAANLDPQWVEGFLFAWLARNAWYGDPVDARSVTGSAQVTILGGVYEADSDGE
ncbi:MAG: anhydro-N-acetylmuramic acid kinase [Gammaproteobacteria bacterium]